MLLTRFVRVVHQDAALLSGTIRSNLDPQVTKNTNNQIRLVGKLVIKIIGIIFTLPLLLKGQMGDTLLWELLERLNLRDLVADGGLEAKVRSDERVIDCNEKDCGTW